MLPKKNRADTKAVKIIFKEGKFIVSPTLLFRFIIKSAKSIGQTYGNSHRSDLWADLPKISFIVPKSVAKLAVKRNLLRRRGYAALSKYLDQFPLGLVGVFVFKKYQEDILIIENEIKNILKKIN